MLALQKVKPGKGAKLVQIDAPRIGRYDLLIRVTRASICARPSSRVEATR